VPNTFQLVTFNQVPLQSNWTPLGSAGAYTGFSTTAAGTYLVTYSANFERTLLAGATADFRVLLNNSEILGSQASAAASTNGLPIRPANAFTVTVSPTGTLSYQFAASTTSGELISDGNGSAGVPVSAQETSFTTTITRIN